MHNLEEKESLNNNSVCKDIDPSLEYKYLDIHMFRKNYITGEEKCNYEIYMREFLNASRFFKELSRGKDYKAPSDESCGQPDALTLCYDIDFKLMVSMSKVETSYYFSHCIEKLRDGAYAFGSSRKEGKNDCILICHALRYKNCSELEAIKNKKPKDLVESEIKNYLKLIEKPKHIMLFMPCVFSYKQERGFKEAVEGIMQGLFHDIRESIIYRNKHIKGYDAFLATLYSDCMLFFQLYEDRIECVDQVEILKSATFMYLYDIGSFGA